MTRLRRALGPLTAVWLSCQFGTVALVPAALWISTAAPEEECTCGHGAGAMCPMHHKPTGERAPCAMQAAGNIETAVLTAATGVAGFIPVLTLKIRPPDFSVDVRPDGVHVVGERPVPPYPPPPRI